MNARGTESDKSSRGPQPGAQFAELVGNTPLLRLTRVSLAYPGITVLAKAEWHNPGGSVKDRAALRMIQEGERSGKLTRDKIILDATSGNTGIAYACLAAARGYRLRLCVPANVSLERKRILVALAAEVIYTDPMQGSDGAILEARRLYAENPKQYFYPDQYSNDANWQAHYHTTGPEIVRQTGGDITAYVSTVGTGGTLTGTGRYLREYNPEIRIIAVEPDSPFHGLEGMKHMASSIRPKFYDPKFADETMFVSTEDSHEAILRLARSEGVLVGLSSGAALSAVLRVAKLYAERGEKATLVTLFPDNSDKYLSERFWEDKER